MSADRKIYDMAAPISPDVPGSPSKAEVDALYLIFQGKPIPPDTLEAMLLSTNTTNRSLVSQAVINWNKATVIKNGELAGKETFRNMALNTLTFAIAMGSASVSGDRYELRRTKLADALVERGMNDLETTT